MERADIAIIGTGPAGVSAAITAKVRGKTVLLFGSRELSSKLTKAHKIQNYPGLPDIDGAQLAQAFKKHLDVLEIPITEKQVTAVYAMGGYFGIQTPDAMLEASSVILAGGVVMGKTFPKEDELLGRLFVILIAAVQRCFVVHVEVVHDTDLLLLFAGTFRSLC